MGTVGGGVIPSLRWWSAAAGLVCAGLLLFWVLPVSTIQVTGAHKPSTQAWMQALQEQCLGRTAWSCRTALLRQHQGQAPWVKHVASHRVGLQTVRWTLQEHEAVATWYRGGVFVAEGTWLPLAQEAMPQVPVLEGPESLKMQIWTDWQHLQSLWTPQVPPAQHVQVNLRGSWVVSLVGGVAIILGSEQLEARVQRFVKSYGTVMSRHARGFAYVDLRYTQGMALGWRNAASGDPSALVQG